MISPLLMNSVSFRGTNLLENFKKAHNIQTAPVTVPETLKGAEAAANYNKAIMNSTPAVITDIKPSEPITIKGDEADTLQGEKVLRSDGTLEAIIVKGDKTTKEYHFYPDKLMNEIIEKDNATGKVIKEAGFGTKYNKLAAGSVTEYDNVTGEEIKYTAFDEGRLSYTTETKNRQKRSVGYNEDGTVRYTSEIDNANGMEKVTEFKNGKIDTIIYYKDDEIQMKTTYAADSDGIIQYTNNKISVPDFDLNKIKEEFKPADINSVKIPENVAALQGEKKLRSNGTLESIEVKGEGNKSTEYFMDFDGKRVTRGLEKENGMTVRSFSTYKNGNIFSIEGLGDNSTTTYFKENGKVDGIALMSEGVHKHMDYSKDGDFVNFYDEWDTKAERIIKRVLLDKNGEIIRCTKDTPAGYVTIKKGLPQD